MESPGVAISFDLPGLSYEDDAMHAAIGDFLHALEGADVYFAQAASRKPGGKGLGEVLIVISSAPVIVKLIEVIGCWLVNDRPGNRAVVLTRERNGAVETVRVTGTNVSDGTIHEMVQRIAGPDDNA